MASDAGRGYDLPSDGEGSANQYSDRGYPYGDSSNDRCDGMPSTRQGSSGGRSPTLQVSSADATLEETLAAQQEEIAELVTSGLRKLSAIVLEGHQRVVRVLEQRVAQLTSSNTELEATNARLRIQTSEPPASISELQCCNDTEVTPPTTAPRRASPPIRTSTNSGARPPRQVSNPEIPGKPIPTLNSKLVNEVTDLSEISGIQVSETSTKALEGSRGVGLNSATVTPNGDHDTPADCQQKSSVWHGRQLEVLPVWQTVSNNVLKRERASENLGTGRLFSGSLKMTEDLHSDWQPKGYLARLMLRPSSVEHFCWDLGGLIFIAYDCVAAPLEVFQLDDTGFSTAMGWLSRVFWTLNVGVMFITGYMKKDGTVEMKPEAVARHYVKTWIAFDIVVVFCSWIEVIFHDVISNRGFRSIRALRMLRTVRLIQLMKAPERARFITDNIRSEEVFLFSSILKIAVVMLLMAHLLACSWYWVGDVVRDDRRWVENHGVLDLPIAERYTWSLHWAISQFSGESLYAPLNVYERSFTSVVLFLCFMASTGIVSSLTTAMTRIQLISSKSSSQFSALRRFLRDNSISRPLTLRVQKNAQHAMSEQKRRTPESGIELLQLISEPLLVELHYEVRIRILEEHPFFLFYKEVYPAGIRLICHKAVSELSLSQNDVLFSAYQVPGKSAKMFFLVEGVMEYSHSPEEACKGWTKTIRSRSWLSEHVLWTRWTHLGTVVASTDCQLLSLGAEIFQQIASHFPSDQLRDYAQTFVKGLNQTAPSKAHCRGDIGAGVAKLLKVCHRVFVEGPTFSESGTESKDLQIDGEESSTDDDETWDSRASAHMKQAVNLLFTRARSNSNSRSGGTASHSLRKSGGLFQQSGRDSCRSAEASSKMSRVEPS